mmetsp:Transcript_26494/g.43849  ORF Transcript_26494/g.43849 Transcript_26494/m.43849 type:complete len:123 (-) Transcript_26494:104-472(-)
MVFLREKKKRHKLGISICGMHQQQLPQKAFLLISISGTLGDNKHHQKKFQLFVKYGIKVRDLLATLGCSYRPVALSQNQYSNALSTGVCESDARHLEGGKHDRSTVMEIEGKPFDLIFGLYA